MLGEDFDFAKRDRVILRELSANSRVSLAHIAKVVGCSGMTASKLIERLVKKLDIRFTIEVDLDKLGFIERHILYVKFRKKPEEAFLRNLFRDDAVVQDAYFMEGNFGLLIFAATDTPMSYIKWETDLAVNLSDYTPEIRPSEFVYEVIGYMPLDGAFVNHIKSAIKVDRKDKLILRLLNENSRMGYRAMSTTLGISEDTIRYRVFRLLHAGIIRKFTIAVQGAHGILSAYFVRYSFDRNTIDRIFPEQRRHHIEEGMDLPLFNATPLVAILSGSYRFFAFSFGKTRKEALDSGLKWHMNLLKNNNPHEAHAIVVTPLKGLLPLRNLDVKRNYRFIWK